MNAEQIADPGHPPDTNGTTQYAWDYENRLTSVTLPDQSVVSFNYDPFGRRIQKSSPSGTVNYVYDGANAIEEVSTLGAVIARYVQGAGIDEPLAQSRSGLSFYHADGLGSITALSDSSGTALATYTYDAFGNLTASTGSDGNPYRYTAREYDPETGLYYYRARYYDSGTGRFLTEDPKRFFSGSNYYGYVKSSPINLVDAFGLAGSHPQSLDGAWNQARMLLSDPDCARFLKDVLVNLHDLPNLDLFLQNFDNTNFLFNPRHDPFAGADSYIAHVDNITLKPSNNTVHVHPDARGSANCCIVGVTMLHEVLHTYPYAFTDFDIAHAVGYKGSPADGMKPASRYFSHEMEDHCVKACKK